MGAMKTILFPHYEKLESEFEEKNNRRPTIEESMELWKQAQLQWEEEFYARNDF